MKNSLKDCKIFYQNVRGLNSKTHVLDDYEPSLIWLVETLLAKEQQTEILGYGKYRNDGTKSSKGIMIEEIALKAYQLKRK